MSKTLKVVVGSVLICMMAFSVFMFLMPTESAYALVRDCEGEFDECMWGCRGQEHCLEWCLALWLGCVT